MTTTATPKQVDFINTLLRERNLPEGFEAMVKAAASDADTFTTKVASGFISSMLGMAKRPVVSSEAEALAAALVGVDKSFYAVRTDDLAPSLSESLRRALGSNDLAFFRVKLYGRTVRLVRVIGSPGYFRALRVSPADALHVLRFINIDPVASSRLFGEHYTCCGRCGAPLTDEVSRRTQFGPTCRKAKGITV